MSSIVIKGNTSGQVEIAAPDVAGSTTLTLPTGNGTVITDTAPKTGNVIQVVNATSTSFASTTSTSFVNTNLSASITPSSSSSKILILVQGQAYIAGAASTDQMISTIVRNSTNLGHVDRGMMQSTYQGNASMIYLDSPSTTSSITYKVQFKLYSGSKTVYFGVDGTPQTMTLMEIAG